MRLIESVSEIESHFMIMKSVIGIRTLVSIVLLSVGSCGRNTEIPKVTELATFSKYGISFKYPEDFSVSEKGMLESEANDNSGMVQAGIYKEEVKSFQAGWIKTLQYDLEGGLEGGFEGMERTIGVAFVERGERVDTTKAGHRTLYQYHSATSIRGDKVYGISAVFYCHQSQKGYQMLTMNNTISKKQDILEDFRTYLDSFTCH